MFGRKQDPAADVTSETPIDEHDPKAPKGRPTPSRREAEAARKHQLKIPKDPKAAKKAVRERDREDRARSRAGMMAGDERYLPARDKGENPDAIEITMASVNPITPPLLAL